MESHPISPPSEWKLPPCPDLADRHLVVGPRSARLVGTDDRGAAQSLHGGAGSPDRRSSFAIRRRVPRPGGVVMTAGRPVG